MCADPIIDLKLLSLSENHDRLDFRLFKAAALVPGLLDPTFGPNSSHLCPGLLDVICNNQLAGASTLQIVSS